MNKEYIEIAGIKVLKQRLQAEPNGVDIFEKDGEYYFTWEAANREAKAQGLRLSTKEEMIQMAQSFDGYEDGKWCEARKTLADTLGMRLSGYRFSDGKWNNATDLGYSWSASERGSGSAWYMVFNEDEGAMSADSKSVSFPVRFCQDSIIGQFDYSDDKACIDNGSNLINCNIHTHEDTTLIEEEVLEYLDDNELSASFGYELNKFLKHFNLIK